jgi:hypothetical protein
MFRLRAGLDADGNDDDAPQFDDELDEVSNVLTDRVAFCPGLLSVGVTFGSISVRVQEQADQMSKQWGSKRQRFYNTDYRDDNADDSQDEEELGTRVCVFCI